MSNELLELNEKLRRESELRTRAAEAFLKAVLDNAAEAIISLDGDMMIVALNIAAEQIFGFKSAELINRPIDVLFEDGAVESAAFRRRVADQGSGASSPQVVEVRCRRQQGKLFPAELSFFRMPLENETVVISFWRDISERKANHAMLIAAAEEAQAASLSKTTFLANMSHELRTPLNAIIGFADLMSQEVYGAIKPEKYREYIKDIRDSGGHLLQLVNDILDLSRIESGHHDLALEPMQIAELAASVVRQFGLLAQKQEVELVVRIPEGLPCILADRRAVRQVLYNLLSNAIKFTRAGGGVSLSASPGPCGVEIIVEDTGIGIPKDVLPRLGNPFEQVASSDARTHGGAGLGLAITRRLVGLQNGTMTMTSELGVGTRIEVCFPATDILSKVG